MPVAVLVASFLFNLGQGVLRPALPLYLEQSFAANYQVVGTASPFFFEAACMVLAAVAVAWLPVGPTHAANGSTPAQRQDRSQSAARPL